MGYKHYKCKDCGYDKEIDTNHYGECYSIANYNTCPSCQPTVHDKYHKSVTWVFAGELPKDAWIPEPWQKITISGFNTNHKNKKK